MQNEEEKKECTCEPGCCNDSKPEKPSRWKNALFILVLVAALGIIAFRVFDNKSRQCCDKGKCTTDTVKTDCCAGGSQNCGKK